MHGYGETSFIKRAIAACALTLAVSFMPHAAAAQDAAATYPSRAIRIIVPYAAGGGFDIQARLIGQKLNESLKQPVIIENKPGASGELATEYVKNAAPDGHTLLITGSGSMAVSAAVNKKLPYSPLRDFAHISLISSFPLVLVVDKSLPIHSVSDFVAYAKAHPDKANYAEPAVAFQIVMEIFKLKTGAPLQYIPYKSTTEALTAVMGGNAIAALADTGPAAGLIKSGQVRPLAVTALARLPEFPDVPTMREAGLPDLSISFWSGVFAPAATPPAVVKKLEQELIRIVNLPDVQQRMKTMMVIPEGRSSEETRKFIAGQIDVFADVVKQAKLSKD